MPSDRDKLREPPPPEVWERAPRLTPKLVAREPQLISDGGGLPFAPAAAFAPFGALDPADPKVAALLVQIDRGRRQAQPERLLRPRAKPAPMATEEKLSGWRELASADGEALFGRGHPPQLLTVSVKRGRRDSWAPIGVSNSRPLRATRDGARASSWRLDPNFASALEGAQTELRILLTEQTMATGALAAERLLPPELHLDESEVMVRLYVAPLEGYVGRTSRHETPVIVELPEPVKGRRVVDGALYQPPRG